MIIFNRKITVLYSLLVYILWYGMGKIPTIGRAEQEQG
jgi:hypothetical protein